MEGGNKNIRKLPFCSTRLHQRRPKADRRADGHREATGYLQRPGGRKKKKEKKRPGGGEEIAFPKARHNTTHPKQMSTQPRAQGSWAKPGSKGVEVYNTKWCKKRETQRDVLRGMGEAWVRHGPGLWPFLDCKTTRWHSMTVDGSNDNFACRWSHGWFGAPMSLGARAAANQTREHRERDRGFNLRWKLASWLKELADDEGVGWPRTNEHGF